MIDSFLENFKENINAAIPPAIEIKNRFISPLKTPKVFKITTLPTPEPNRLIK